VPTLYPKCPPSEVLGFLVILNTHRGSQEIARVAEEENLPIDKILPAVEYAQGLGLLTVDDGRATLTDSGRMLLAAGIQTRKVLLRELLKRTILFRAILRSLEQSVDRTVSEDELAQIIAFTTAPPESIQDIINWGRYTELFRYDVTQHAILPMGTKGRSSPPMPAIPMPAAPRSPPSTRNSPPRNGTMNSGPVPRTPGPRSSGTRASPSVAAPTRGRPGSSNGATDGPKKKAPPAA
jgi:hypothetical protein